MTGIELSDVEIVLRHLKHVFPFDDDPNAGQWRYYGLAKTLEIVKEGAGIRAVFDYTGPNGRRKANIYYQTTKINALRYPEQVSRLSAILGIDYNVAYDLFLDVDPDDDEAIERLKRNVCIECGHELGRGQSVVWRFELHPIRCGHCVSFLIQRGWSEFEAFYMQGGPKDE